MRGSLINIAPHFRKDHICSRHCLQILFTSLAFPTHHLPPPHPPPTFLSISRKNRIHFRAQLPPLCSKSDESSILLLIVFSAILFAHKKFMFFLCLCSFKNGAAGKIFLLCLRRDKIGRNGVSCSGLEVELMVGICTWLLAPLIDGNEL